MKSSLQTECLTIRFRPEAAVQDVGNPGKVTCGSTQSLHTYSQELQDLFQVSKHSNMSEFCLFHPAKSSILIYKNNKSTHWPVCNSFWSCWPCRLAWKEVDIPRCIQQGSDPHLCLLNPAEFSWRTCLHLLKPASPALASTPTALTFTPGTQQNASYQCFKCGLHLGLFFDVFKEWLDSMGSWLSQSSEWVLLKRRPMELAQLHRTHVSGEEGLPQLQCGDGVLL